ncbi:MAG: hypothetical protein PWQ99_664 [Clostridia bacterium]|nr:hypothetical protein [Clostridia bacterium]
MIKILRLMRKWRLLTGVLCLSMALFLGWPAPVGAYTVLNEEVFSEPVAAGVTLQTYRQMTDEGPLMIYVLNVDLTNPYVKIDTIIGADNRSFEKASPVLSKAGAAGAVAAVNGDFFHLTEGKHPLGFTVQNGEVLTTPMLWGDFNAFALTRDLAPFIGRFSFTGEVRVIPPEGSGDPASFPLSGINKPRYSARVDGQVVVSDTNRLQMYNRVWGPVSRGAQADLPGWTEVVVEDGRVLEMRIDQPPVEIPVGGFILSGHGEAARFLQEHCLPGAQVDVDYAITPLGEEIQTAIGGKDLLVVDGWVAPSFSKELEGKFARTAVACSRDGKRLYLVAVEGGKGSRGMRLQELAGFLVERLGAWNAINLDGGGSTTMVARPLGETGLVLVNTPAQGTQRSVPNALGVFSTAPAGELSGLVIKGPGEVLAGLDYSYKVSGYDQYYNPFTVDQENVTWRIVKGSGSIEGGVLRADQGGALVIEASYGGVSKEFAVKALGAADLKGLEIQPGVVKVDPGKTVSLRVRALGKDGRSWDIPASRIRWEITGAVGTINNGVFTAGSEDAAGQIKAHFLGLTAVIPVTVGTPVPEDVRNHWALPQVKELLKRGVVSGYPDGTFRPDRMVTRGEFVVMLANALDWTAPSVALPFKDEIPDWVRPCLQAAYGKGVVSGFPDGTFRPDQKITRAELAVMVAGALNLPAAQKTVAFEDAGKIPSWARDAVQRVAAAGLMVGYGGYFRPLDNATRAEVAAVICAVLNANP